MGCQVLQSRYPLRSLKSTARTDLVDIDGRNGAPEIWQHDRTNPVGLLNARKREQI